MHQGGTPPTACVMAGCVQVNQSTNFQELLDKEKWLNASKLVRPDSNARGATGRAIHHMGTSASAQTGICVPGAPPAQGLRACASNGADWSNGPMAQVVKPDMLFGKRGKNDLLALNVDYSQAETFITERMNKQVPQNLVPRITTGYQALLIALHALRGNCCRIAPIQRLLGVAQVTVDGCSGGVHTFIVEPFVPHEVEYYLCIQSHRLGDAISFSDAGVTSLPIVSPPHAIHVRPLVLPACCFIFLSGNASVLATPASCQGTRPARPLAVTSKQ